jgi:hypothetical protein
LEGWSRRPTNLEVDSVLGENDLGSTSSSGKGDVSLERSTFDRGREAGNEVGDVVVEIGVKLGRAENEKGRKISADLAYEGRKKRERTYARDSASLSNSRSDPFEFMYRIEGPKTRSKPVVMFMVAEPR